MFWKNFEEKYAKKIFGGKQTLPCHYCRNFAYTYFLKVLCNNIEQTANTYKLNARNKVLINIIIMLAD